MAWKDRYVIAAVVIELAAQRSLQPSLLLLSPCFEMRCGWLSSQFGPMKCIETSMAGWLNVRPVVEPSRERSSGCVISAAFQLHCILACYSGLLRSEGD